MHRKAGGQCRLAGYMGATRPPMARMCTHTAPVGDCHSRLNVLRTAWRRPSAGFLVQLRQRTGDALVVQPGVRHEHLQKQPTRAAVCVLQPTNGVQGWVESLH